MTQLIPAAGEDNKYQATISSRFLDNETITRFANCAKALGITVDGRKRPANLAEARLGFTSLSASAGEHCDIWVGLAAAGDNSPHVIEKIYQTLGSAGVLQRAINIPTGSLSYHYFSGQYLELSASTPQEYTLSYAAAFINAGQFAEADVVLQEHNDLNSNTGSSLNYLWMQTVLHYNSQRWDKVVEILTPQLKKIPPDPLFAQVMRVTLGISLAKLGLFSPALTYLNDSSGPQLEAAADGTYAKALSLRAIGENQQAEEVLQQLYATRSSDPQILAALEDKSFGLTVTNRERIAARTDPWNAQTEPTENNFISPSEREYKDQILQEAETQLNSFVGIEEVKDQVSRLKSSVSLALLRQARGLSVAGRTNHLVFAGPPGTGKTAIARIVAKIYCGLGLLKKDSITEVTRADLVGQHIGETEAKTGAILDQAMDGVLFIDEAYTLVSTGAKNDFGLVAIDTLLARMENDRNRLVVIIAGYQADLEKFLSANEGLRSRFTRTIDFKSYSPQELAEIARRMGRSRDTIFSSDAVVELERVFSFLSVQEQSDANNITRRCIDLAGNGRFVRNLVEKSEEEREHRLAQTSLDSLTDEQLMTVTEVDVARASDILMHNLGIGVNE